MSKSHEAFRSSYQPNKEGLCSGGEMEKALTDMSEAHQLRVPTF